MTSLSNLSTTPVYRPRTYSQLPPAAVNQGMCWDRPQDQDREKGCTWTSDGWIGILCSQEYVDILLQRDKSQPVLEWHIRDATEMG